jgi:glycosyltransferase involved in cell wall biosynthesis
MWRRINLPKIDHWCGDADWVYAPCEAYVAAKRPRLAVTVHDLHAFEPDLPWSGTPAHQAFRRRWAEMFRPIVRRADRILAVSAFTERRLVELLGVDPRRITVVGNGVDPVYFDPTGGPPPSELSEPYVLVVGGLTQRKGGDLVLGAAQALQRWMPQLCVGIVGFGEPELERKAAALPNVTLLGFVETERLALLLRGAVGMMLLSRYEGFGIPVVEAMAAGAPVIVSRWGALPEVAGDAGVLVDAENAGEVVAAIAMLSNDAAVRRDLQARGRERAEGYRWDRCVERLVAALRKQ